MSDNSANNKRIAKNTLMLYIRMLLIMGVSLYTSRVILQALGVKDFGLYNIVGGVVVLFTFINNAMVTSTQRFLNYELGRNNQEEAKRIFSASLTIHFAIAAIFLFFSETIGLWFLNTYIQIPSGRETAANWVYQFTIATSIINIIRTPYNASIIAHERMSFYAYISIIEVVLKLLIVFLVYLFTDRLISYAALITIVTLAIFGGYYLFCRRKFPICRYKFEYDKQRYLSIASFSGWSLFGSVANMGSQQGTNILLNMFFGVAINAAMGIANQVNAAIYHFVSNFQTAFNPQLIKSCATGDRNYFNNLILNTSRYSFLLLFFLALPIYICAPQILQIWLGTVPEHAVEFCRLMLIFSLIDSIQGPLWISIQATGKIKKYQLFISSLILLNIPITYIAFCFFNTPEIALIIRIFINFIALIFRITYSHKLIKFPIRKYFQEVLLKCSTLVILTFPLLFYTSKIDTNIPTPYLLTTSIIYSLTVAYAIGVKSSEKNILLKSLKRIIKMTPKNQPRKNKIQSTLLRYLGYISAFFINMPKFGGIRINATIKFNLIGHQLPNNWGDDLNICFLKKIIEKPIIYYPNSLISRFFKKTNYICIGSTIETRSNPNAIIWGAGLMYENGKCTPPKKIHAVRGPLTRKRLLQLGISCPPIYGDPALLIPYYYTPLKNKKKFRIGFIPHYVDQKNPLLLKLLSSDEHKSTLIDLKKYNKWTDIIDIVVSCEFIVSSSLHGLIISDAYNIPNVWVEFSKNIHGNRFKFLDYYESVNKKNMIPIEITKSTTIEELCSLQNQYTTINIDLQPLIKACPFKLNKSYFQ